jgi:calcineurin-like phosphoesterase family protein
MNYWITTDTHFGHENLTKLCGRPPGFSEKILINMNRTITCPDIMIHLGDICMGDEEYWHKELSKWCCAKKWLIRGNHDKKSDTWYLEHGWSFVGELIWLNKFGKKIVLSHKPVEDIGYDINIHGHFHNSDLHLHEPELVAIKNNKQHLVALEYLNYMPINLEKIIRKGQDE